MEKQNWRLPDISTFSRREKTLLGVAAALLALVIAVVCISINIRVNMQQEYTAVRGTIGEALYSDLYMMTQTFDMASVPNANLEESIIPQMKNYFAAATALNDILSRAYGQRYRLMTDADINAVNTTFAAFDAAFRSGAPTDLAQADMKNCMTRVRELLSTRYSEGTLHAAR